jgi:lysyl-tRNA synthetase class I
MSNKNPFELRFDVLKMAKEMMDQQHEIANNQFYQMVDQAREQNKNIQEVFEKYTPKMYQPKEIMDKADELYKFITKRD